MVGHGGSSAGSYLADPTSSIPSHCASIVATSTVRVNSEQYQKSAHGESLFGATIRHTKFQLKTLLLLLTNQQCVLRRVMTPNVPETNFSFDIGFMYPMKLFEVYITPFGICNL